MNGTHLHNIESRVSENILPLVTKRELEVLVLMSKGFTSKEIADNMFVSAHTIISHKKNLVQKFDARNSLDLMVKAIRSGHIEV